MTCSTAVFKDKNSKKQNKILLVLQNNAHTGKKGRKKRKEKGIRKNYLMSVALGDNEVQQITHAIRMF